MKLWDEFADMQDKFAIVAVHNPHPQAQNFEELDKRLEEKGLIKRWGRNLPFTVILDNSKTSTAAYGVQAYPTTVLIDPEGKVVKGNAERLLHEKLAEMKKGKPGTAEGADAKPAEDEKAKPER